MDWGKKYFDIYIPEPEPEVDKGPLLFSKQPEKTSFFSFNLPSLKSEKKKNFWIFVFVLTLFCWGIFTTFAVINLKNEIRKKVEDSVFKLKQAQNIAFEDPQRAQDFLGEAQKDINLALGKYQKIKIFTFPAFLVYPPLKDIEYILHGSDLLVSAVVDAFSLYKKISILTIDQPHLEAKIERVLSEKDQWEKDVQKIYAKYLATKFLWEAVNQDSLPSEIKEKFQKVKNDFDTISPLFDLGFQTISSLDKLLGKEKLQRYLLLLENNYELRPGGGFIGTYGIWEFEDGKTKFFDLEGVSNLEYKNEHFQLAPYPLSEIVSYLKFMDSNIWPDFAASAQESLKFYEKWTGQKIDGVIGITPTFIKDVLKIIGPVELPEYNLVVDSDNFFQTIQFEVEAGKDKKNWQDPKKVIYLFADRVLDKIYYQATPSQYLAILQSFLENLNEKHILFYFKDKDLQNFVEQWNFGGRVKDARGEDYLMLVNWNLGGLKSSLFVEQKVDHKIFIKENGEVEAQLIIRRHHTKDYSYPYYDNFTKRYLWLIGANKNYMKIYLPEGSKIIKTENTGSTNSFSELGKEVLGFWFTTQPLEEKEVKIKYRLPFKVEKIPTVYKLLLQKQPGDEGYDYSLTVESAKGTIFSPLNFIQENKKALFRTFVNSDIEIVFGLK